MNTVGSVYYGWAFFIAVGAGSYYFAKKSVNADREQRQRTEMARMAKQRRDLDAYERTKTSQVAGSQGSQGSQAEGGIGGGEGGAGGMGAVRGSGMRGEEKSPYEAARPYRSRKGDRFS